jgi:hypothetical protein
MMSDGNSSQPTAQGRYRELSGMGREILSDETVRSRDGTAPAYKMGDVGLIGASGAGGDGGL